MATLLINERQAGIDAYSAKSQNYFSGARLDYVNALPDKPDAHVLEIGCGAGATGGAALAQGKCSIYCGIEICPKAANNAKRWLTQVITGDVEAMDFPWPPETFDALVLSEILEHLADPWAVLRRLHRLMKPGGLVFASSPNASHYRFIMMLARGDWTLSDSGVMDRTHLRWFTPKAYRSLFESAGFHVDSIRELSPLSTKARIGNAITLGQMRHLFVVQMDLRAHCL